MLGIFVITFNTPADVLICQLDGIKKFCKDVHDVIIFDNSCYEENAKAIKYHCEQRGVQYIRLNATTKDPSQSHAWAANMSYNLYSKYYNYLLYLDHDCIPIADFSIIDILAGKNIGGVGQGKKKTYIWPGCLAYDNRFGVELDFSVNREFGLDTGGNTYKIVEKAPEGVVHFSERYVQNEDWEGKYNYYSIINEQFMHFVNTSNWNGQSSEERINSLVGIARKYINGE